MLGRLRKRRSASPSVDDIVPLNCGSWTIFGKSRRQASALLALKDCVRAEGAMIALSWSRQLSYEKDHQPIGMKRKLTTRVVIVSSPRRRKLSAAFGDGAREASHTA